jgi:hypothetical protein
MFNIFFNTLIHIPLLDLTVTEIRVEVAAEGIMLDIWGEGLPLLMTQPRTLMATAVVILLFLLQHHKTKYEVLHFLPELF